MTQPFFSEGVKPGGLTSSTEIRILLCYLLDSIHTPVSREQLEQVLVGEELANYFVMADSLAQLEQQQLLQLDPQGYRITPAGRTVAQTLSSEVPRSVRETAVRGVIRAQQYAAKQAAHQCELRKTENGFAVDCQIGDSTGPLYRMELYMPNELTAESVRDCFVEHGDQVYKLVLAALTGNRTIAEQTLNNIKID